MPIIIPYSNKYIVDIESRFVLNIFILNNIIQFFIWFLNNFINILS